MKKITKENLEEFTKKTIKVVLESRKDLDEKVASFKKKDGDRIISALQLSTGQFSIFSFISDDNFNYSEFVMTIYRSESIIIFDSNKGGHYTEEKLTSEIKMVFEQIYIAQEFLEDRKKGFEHHIEKNEKKLRKIYDTFISKNFKSFRKNCLIFLSFLDFHLFFMYYIKKSIAVKVNLPIYITKDSKGYTCLTTIIGKNVNLPLLYVFDKDVCIEYQNYANKLGISLEEAIDILDVDIRPYKTVMMTYLISSFKDK